MSTPVFTESPLGKPALRGAMRPAADGCEVVAAGTDIWMDSDEGHLAYIAHDGDFDIRARVAAFEATHLYAKAGLMVRESLASGSRHVFFLVFHDNAARNNNNGGFEGQFRPKADGPSFGIYPPQPDPVPPRFPVRFPDTWLRLVRRRDEFELHAGMKGGDWTLFARTSFALPRRVLLGLAVTSHDPASLATAKFREIEIRQ